MLNDLICFDLIYHICTKNTRTKTATRLRLFYHDFVFFFRYTECTLVWFYFSPYDLHVYVAIVQFKSQNIFYSKWFLFLGGIWIERALRVVIIEQSPKYITKILAFELLVLLFYAFQWTLQIVYQMLHV